MRNTRCSMKRAGAVCRASTAISPPDMAKNSATPNDPDGPPKILASRSSWRNTSVK